MFKSIRYKIAMAVVAAALLSVLAANSTFAASKVFEVSGHNVSFGPLPLGSICGVDDYIAGSSSFHTIIWDTGHLEVNLVQVGSLNDGVTGKKTGSARGTLHYSGEASGPPFNFVTSGVITCVGSGVLLNDHIITGVTIDGNGVVHIHGP
jgi:hypothetical protein